MIQYHLKDILVSWASCSFVQGCTEEDIVATSLVFYPQLVALEFGQFLVILHRCVQDLISP